MKLVLLGAKFSPEAAQLATAFLGAARPTPTDLQRNGRSDETPNK